MKIVLCLFITCILQGFNAQCQSKDMIRQQPCHQESMQYQADSIRRHMGAEGFTLLKEASMKMESEYEMPVIVPLQEGSWYHFVFIGDVVSKLFEVRVYDWDEKQVVYEKNLAGDPTAHIIAFSYIPKFTEYYMFKPVQVSKKNMNGLCGYVMLFSKTKPATL
jgi:hypothetical protein